MALINCPKCGKQVSEYAPTCPSCGTVINTLPQKKVFCKYCGTEINEDAKFCPSCGKTQFPATSQIQQPAPRQQPYQQPAPRQQSYQQPAPRQQPYQNQQPYQQPASVQGFSNVSSQTTNTTVVVNGPSSNSVGTAGLIFALLAWFFSWVPVLNVVFWVLGVLLSFIGLFKSPRGLAITGLVVSFIGIIILMAIFGSIMAFIK